METLTIDQYNKNYFEALDILEEVYSFYKSNQPSELYNTWPSGHFLTTRLNTIGYPLYGKAFLDSLRSVAVFIMPTVTVTAYYKPEEFCKIIVPLVINEFCRGHGLERALKIYKNVICRIFKDASAITLSLSKDPEIENHIKVCSNIKIKADIQSILQMDREFFETIDSIIPNNERDFFVKTYEIIE